MPPSYRTFQFFWAVQTISLVGSTITPFALSVWATENSDRIGLSVSWALAWIGVSTLPGLFWGIYAGALIDRYPRKRFIVINDLATAGVMSVTALTVLAGWPFWTTIMSLAVQSLLTTMDYILFDASISLLVAEADLPRANALNQLTSSALMLLAPTIAASIIALPIEDIGVLQRIQESLPDGWFLSGVALVLILDAITCLVTAVGMLPLRMPNPEAVEDTPSVSFWRDVTSGIHYLLQDKVLVNLLVFFSVGNLLVSPGVTLLPAIIRERTMNSIESLGLNFEQGLALAITSGSAGLLVSGALLSIFAKEGRDPRLAVLVPVLGIDVALMVVGMSQWILLTALALFARGFLLPLSNTYLQTIWQMRTPAGIQGRVFSVRRASVLSVTPIGTLLAGSLGSVMDLSHIIIAGSAISAIYTIVLLFRLKLDNDPPLHKIVNKDRST
jgi:MFS family permease